MIESSNVPAVSIVMPAFNAEPYIRCTIDAVIAQSETGWELIVVNDGSKDGTLEILAQYANNDSRIRVFDQENLGPSATRNNGFRRSDKRAPYVIFLDADDVWYPHALHTLLAVLERAPECLAAHGVAGLIDADGNAIGSNLQDAPRRLFVDGLFIKSMREHLPTCFSSITYVNHISTPGCVLLKRSALSGDGLFSLDPAYYGIEDWELWLRLLVAGEFAYTSQKVIQYRQHAESITKSGKRHTEGAVILRRKLLTDYSLSASQRHCVRHGYRMRELRKSVGDFQVTARMLASLKLQDAVVNWKSGMRHMSSAYQRL